MNHGDCVHHTLHLRLATLARFNPTSNEFKQCFHEGMFKKANQKGFHEVVYFLLKLVDLNKCKEKLQWPLWDKKLEQEFRKGVQTIIAEINQEDEKCNIPIITTSVLHSPFGDRLAKFLVCLSEYVMKKQLKTKFNVPVLPQFQNTKNTIISNAWMKHMKVKIQNGIKEIHELEEEHARYMLEANIKFKTYEKTLQNSEMQIKQHDDHLKTICASGEIPDYLKLRILNNDDTALEEWSKHLDEEMNCLEVKLLNLERISNTFSNLQKLIENAVEWKKSPPCLDGDCLIINISTRISETLTMPIYNANGDLLLEGIFSYANYLSEEVRKQITKRYPKNENNSDSKLVLEELTKKSHKLQEINKSLDERSIKMKALITSMQSKLYPHYEEFDQVSLPETVFESPKVNLNENLDVTNIYLEQGDHKQLINKIRKKLHKERKLSVLCSIKHNYYEASAKTVSRIPSLIKSYRKPIFNSLAIEDSSSEVEKVESGNNEILKTPAASSVCTRPKKLVYSRSTSVIKGKSSNKSESKKLDTAKVMFTTPSKKRRSRVSVSPTLESIPDFINDISFTDLKQELEDPALTQSNSTTLRSPENWESYTNLVEPLENISLPEGFENDSLLDMSQSTTPGDSFYNDQRNIEDVKQKNCQAPIVSTAISSVELPTSKTPVRRKSLQAIIDRYKKLKERSQK